MNGHLEVLQWAREHHCPWDKWTAANAAAVGNREVLQWAREHHCPWDEWTCAWAAGGGILASGNLEVLRWAREHDCPWDDWTCAYAAAGWHLKVLQWARARACPWDGRTVAGLGYGGGGEPIQYVDMLAAEEAARLASEDSARLASDAMALEWASAVLLAMALAAAVEAADTWRTTHASFPRTGLCFLLNLLFRPLFSALLQGLSVALAVIIVLAVREVHILDPSTALEPWQHRLDTSAILGILLPLVILLLAIILILLNSLRVLVFLLLISVFAPLPLLARRTGILGLIQILLRILLLVLALLPSLFNPGPRY
jgi:hypothetical protein